jgi:hypothetical protein
LEDEEFLFKYVSRKSDMGRSALDAMRAVVDPSESGDGIFEKKFPFVGTSAGADFNDTAAEAAVFGGKGIGEDAHRFHCGSGEFERGLSRDGIGDAGIVDECTGLIGLSSLDVDESASWKSLLRRTRDLRTFVVSVGLDDVLEVTSTLFSCAVTVTLSVRFSGMSWRSS